MKIVALVSDAWGARGGMAQFNRDMLGALAAHAAVEEVHALPRVVSQPVADVAPRVTFDVHSAGGKWRYARHAWSLARRARVDAVVCGHLNLMPVARIVARRHGAPLLLVIHGYEAWSAPRGWLTRAAVRDADAVVAVSRLTAGRFQAWSRIPDSRVTVIPNGVDTARFSPGPPPPELIARYGLDGRKVIMTIARLSAGEPKGIDRVIGVLPRVRERIPSIVYLVAGEGTDRPRLERLAQTLGVADHVRFVGYMPEEEKVDHLRLADGFAMPSGWEGFGIVFLEAMACGVPVLASSTDAGVEALLGGRLGMLVDPGDADALCAGVLELLTREKGVVPAGLHTFAYERFRERWIEVVDRVFLPGTFSSGRERRGEMPFGVLSGDGQQVTPQHG